MEPSRPFSSHVERKAAFQGVLIGAGAIVLPGLTINDYATVGAGSIVTNDIASGITVMGNPARAV